MASQAFFRTEEYSDESVRSSPQGAHHQVEKKIHKCLQLYKAGCFQYYTLVEKEVIYELIKEEYH